MRRFGGHPGRACPVDVLSVVLVCFVIGERREGVPLMLVWPIAVAVSVPQNRRRGIHREHDGREDEANRIMQANRQHARSTGGHESRVFPCRLQLYAPFPRSALVV